MTESSIVFLDASVLIAGAASLTGGSAAAIAVLAGPDPYRAAVSREVLREALLNVRLKFDRPVLIRLYSVLGDLQPQLADPSDLTAADIPSEVATKDHHVLLASLAVAASVCLTLDRRHLLGDPVRRWAIDRGLRLLTPGEFLEWHRAIEQA